MKFIYLLLFAISCILLLSCGKQGASDIVVNPKKSNPRPNSNPNVGPNTTDDFRSPRKTNNSNPTSPTSNSNIPDNGGDGPGPSIPGGNYQQPRSNTQQNSFGIYLKQGHYQFSEHIFKITVHFKGQQAKTFQRKDDIIACYATGKICGNANKCEVKLRDSNQAKALTFKAPSDSTSFEYNLNKGQKYNIPGKNISRIYCKVLVENQANQGQYAEGSRDVLKAPRCGHLNPNCAANANQTLIARALKANKIEMPKDSFLLAAIIEKGNFTYFSWKESGLVPSKGHFWPASSVKTYAAIGALMEIQKLGLTPDQIIQFKYGDDDSSVYKGTTRELVLTAIKDSSNINYDHLLRIAGIDTLNEEIRKSMNLSHTVLQSKYTRTGNGLQKVPALEIILPSGEKKVARKKRIVSSLNETCLNGWRSGSNCTSLIELLQIQAAIAYDYGPLSKLKDYPILKQALNSTYTSLKPAFRKILGRSAKIYTKPGNIPNKKFVDNALAVTASGKGYAFVIVYPHEKACKQISNPWKQLSCTGEKTNDIGLAILKELVRYKD